MRSGSTLARRLGATAHAALFATASVEAAEPVAAPASAALSTSPPLVFRQDDPVGVPVGGAVLLAVLLVIAGFVWWARRRSVPVDWLAGVGRGRGVQPGALSVETSLRLDAQTRLYVVRWKGGNLLVAAGGATSPVVLDRTDAPLPSTDQAP